MKKNYTLITGAGRGIGEEIAKEFYKNGHYLYLLVHKKKNINKLKKLFSSTRVKIFSGNINDQKLIKKISKEIPYVNNLINNAAVTNKKFFSDITFTEINNVINTNFISAFILSQIFSKKMIKKKIKGCIVNIGSQLGKVGAKNRTIYCSSKFALEGLTKSSSLDLARFGIRVVGINPTKTITDINEKKINKTRLTKIKKKIPLGRFSTKKEIAETTYFLTTKSAYSITGSSLDIDGGWTAGR